MGLLLSKFDIRRKSETTKSPLKKTEFSWEKRANNVSTKDYLLENKIDCTESRLPGSVNGQQFVIQNCRNSSIFILDYMNSVIVDDCIDSYIILGPTERRNCQNCHVIVACEQFRLRDCIGLKVYLYCPTKPIIESSKEIHFSCFRLHYDNFEEHFNKCDFNIWNNLWFKVHDYTPTNNNDFPNWGIIDTDTDFTNVVIPESLKKLNVLLDDRRCCVPLSQGFIKNDFVNSENCLLIFCDDYSAKAFLKEQHEREKFLKLIKTRQIKVEAMHAEALFFTSDFTNAIRHSSLIGLHLYGEHAIEVCSQLVPMTTETELYYISPNSNMASHQVNTFFSITDLQIDNS